MFSNRSQMASKRGKNKKVAHEAKPSVSLMCVFYIITGSLFLISKYFNITLKPRTLALSRLETSEFRPMIDLFLLMENAPPLFTLHPSRQSIYYFFSFAASLLLLGPGALFLSLTFCFLWPIVQFRIRHGRWIKALTTHLYRVSLDLRKIFINTGGKVPQICKLNNTQSCKQVIFSLEFVNILL